MFPILVVRIPSFIWIILNQYFKCIVRLLYFHLILKKLISHCWFCWLSVFELVSLDVLELWFANPQSKLGRSWGGCRVGVGVSSKHQSFMATSPSIPKAGTGLILTCQDPQDIETLISFSHHASRWPEPMSGLQVVSVFSLPLASPWAVTVLEVFNLLCSWSSPVQTLRFGSESGSRPLPTWATFSSQGPTGVELLPSPPTSRLTAQQDGGFNINFCFVFLFCFFSTDMFILFWGIITSLIFFL